LYTIPLPVLVGKILTWLVAIDVWLAFFNLMPLGPLDGMKILAWDWRVWLLVTGCAGFLLFFV
jgi:Zn-dependent protease